jgi:hypothetical protein
VSKIILAHPFSGAIYSYFSDQMGGGAANTEVLARSHSYYRTLYGKNYASNVDLALCFLLMYDEVWIAPADNRWPDSSIDPGNRAYIPELGLNADWDDFHKSTSGTDGRFVDNLLDEPRLQTVLRTMKIPQPYWNILVQYALYEANLSARLRIPILCSPGRRALISVLIDILEPSLHPQFTGKQEIQFVDIYRQHVGLALAPKSLDHLMKVKRNPAVRKYGNAFLAVVEESYNSELSTEISVAEAILDAMDSEATASMCSGTLNWGAKLFKLAGASTGLPLAFSLGSKLAEGRKEAAGWYEFGGSIEHEISRIQIRDRASAIAGRAPRPL